MTHILVINPGSTSTKIAVFDGATPVFTETIRHEATDLDRFAGVMDQETYRHDLILETLDRHNLVLSDLQAIIGRGGLMHPIDGGVYAVSPTMLDDLRTCRYGTHACNLGAILADTLGREAGLPAFIADPVVVDEMEPLARYSGHPDIARRSIFHALNHKATARRAARDLGAAYKDLRLIVVHLGGGVSIAAHKLGRVVDVNDALDGDGPFSPERSGSLPVGRVLDWCFAPDVDEMEIRRRITGKGGFVAYLGTSSGMEVERRMADGDEKAREVHAAMAYQVAKYIGAMATVLCGRVDAVILTGGLAYDRELTRLIAERTSFIARVLTYPGEDEMEALALAALSALEYPHTVQSYV